jgi:hypothetical protein
MAKKCFTSGRWWQFHAQPPRHGMANLEVLWGDCDHRSIWMVVDAFLIDDLGLAINT